METNQRPRILLIKPILPYPPDLGTKLLSFGLLRALKDHFDVTVLARILSREEESNVPELEKWCSRVVTVLAPNKRSIFHRIFFRIFYYLKTVFLKRSMKSLYDCPGAFLSAARRLSREDFDYIIIEYWQLWRMADLFPVDKMVLLTHDVEMLVNRQNALLERNLFLKMSAVQKWISEKREEVKAYRTFRRILTLTERDQTAVEGIAGGNASVHVLPFGLDPADYAAPENHKNSNEILFLGAMASSFNLDALRYFVRRIYPRIDHIEELSITIVGGKLPKDIAYFSLVEGVEVVGKVRDVRPFLSRASCLIIPLRYGGGLRTRVLEAMFAELPVICSSVAIAGMAFEPEEDYLLADTPDAFASQIERLLGEPKLAKKLSNNAKRKVMENYESSRQARHLQQLLLDFIDKG